MIRRLVLIGAIAALVSSVAVAQFKSQQEAESRVPDGTISSVSSPSFLFGWFDPDRFHMHHSISLSYLTVGGQGGSLGSYTNSMTYDFTENLNARADVSLLYSPLNSFSSTGKGRNNLSSVFLSRAELNYKPWDNVMLQMQYRQVPSSLFYDSFLFSPWYGNGDF